MSACRCNLQVQVQVDLICSSTLPRCVGVWLFGWFSIGSLVAVRLDQTYTRDQIRSTLHNKLDRSDLILISICTTILIDQIELARYFAQQAWSIRSSLHDILRNKLGRSDQACTTLSDCIRMILVVSINTMWGIGWFLWSVQINSCNLTCSRTSLI